MHPVSVPVYTNPSPSAHRTEKFSPGVPNRPELQSERVRQLAGQLAELARSELPPEEFFPEFLKRLVPTFGACRAMIWRSQGGRPLELLTDVQPGQSEPPLEDRVSSGESAEPGPGGQGLGSPGCDAEGDWIRQNWHQKLLKRAEQTPLAAPPKGPEADEASSPDQPDSSPKAGGFRQARGRLDVPSPGQPDSLPTGPSSKNPTGCLLLFAPIGSEAGQSVVVELVLPGSASLAAPRLLRLLAQMAELANRYLRRRRMAELQQEAAFWRQVERFVHQVHARLDPAWTAYTFVNEGRRLLGCDRLSLLVADGNRCRVLAISGSSEFDPRSPALRLLGRLTGAVLAAKEPLVYSGPTDGLAPQVQTFLERYVDQTHTKALVIWPLWPTDEHSAEPNSAQPKEDADGLDWAGSAAEGGTVSANGRPIGALVLEQFEAAEIPAPMRRRLEVVARHGQSALHHSLQYDGIFLRPVWEALGRNAWVVWARSWPRLAWVGLAGAVLLAVFLFTPSRLEVEATGTLAPVAQQDVFASMDGRVEKVLVDHGDRVQGPDAESGRPGTLLCILRNYELEEELARLSGERATLQERLAALSRALLERQLSPVESDRLSAEQASVRQRLQSLDVQLAVCRQKQEQLHIYSPIAGQVITWDVAGLLLRRPVQRGDRLLRIAQTDGPWHVELWVPEDRIGHVLRAKQQAEEPLPVRFILAADPTRSHEGRLVEIDTSAQQRPGEGRTILAKVQIEASQVQPLLPGSQVRARIDCGRCSLGYRWFHDLWAWLRRLWF